VHGATLVASVAFHATAAVGVWVVLRVLAAQGPSPAPGLAADLAPVGSGEVAIELPQAGDGIVPEQRPVDATGEPPRPSGGATQAHPDTGTPGHGGDEHAERALNLADRDEQMRLSPDLISRLDRDQLQRLRVARVRQSWEDRRATTHPMELTLVVTGDGTRLERRTPFPSEPSRGAMRSPSASVQGGDIGAGLPDGAGDTEPRVGSARAGSLLGAPGAGVDSGHPGLDHRAAAPVASARPDVVQGPVTVPAVDRARPRDDVDSDQEVATTVRSLLHASTAGGARGEGLGGNGGGGEAGAGGASGGGSRAQPLGVGTGETFDFWTSDPRLVPYFRRLHARIDPLWVNAFPKSAIYDLKQGTVILQFTVSASGQVAVSWPPLRPSGIDEFDRNCADAIRRAAPLPPIPPELGVSSLTIRAPFVANNPVIR
jgi:TonB family protein